MLLRAQWRALAGVGITLAVAASLLPAQGTLPPDLVLLGRIRERVARDLKALPNYTCGMTIERARRRARAKRYEPQDTLRLEVAMVEGRELFSWPGARRFEDRELTEMVAAPGTLGNGNFGLFLRSIFLGPAPSFTYEGEEEREGRPAHRFAYNVTLLHSGYNLHVPPHLAKVPYRGHFWVDRQSLDMVRLEVRAQEIPLALRLQSVFDATNYRRQPIGDGEFLLPDSSELVMVGVDGDESRNQTRFSGCRQYAGESSLSFEEPDPEPAAPVPATPASAAVALPAGLTVETQLQAFEREPAVGDPVTAVVNRDVRQGRQVLLPKGTRVLGRITRWQRVENRHNGWLATLEFFERESGGALTDWHARLTQVWPLTDMTRPTGMLAGVMLPNLPRGAPPQALLDAFPPNTATFIVLGSTLPRGLRLTWRALPASAPVPGAGKDTP